MTSNEIVAFGKVASDCDALLSSLESLGEDGRAKLNDASLGKHRSILDVVMIQKEVARMRDAIDWYTPGAAPVQAVAATEDEDSDSE